MEIEMGEMWWEFLSFSPHHICCFASAQVFLDRAYSLAHLW